MYRFILVVALLGLAVGCKERKPDNDPSQNYVAMEAERNYYREQIAEYMSREASAQGRATRNRVIIMFLGMGAIAAFVVGTATGAKAKEDTRKSRRYRYPKRRRYRQG